jgi:peptidase E
VRPPRRILAWGGHRFRSSPPDQAVCDYMAGLLDGVRPKVCLLPTASGDPTDQIARFHSAFAARGCETSDVSLFRLAQRPIALRDHLLAQDLIYVGGGSMLNLLAVWEAHDISAIMGLAWERGTVLAGQSAGAMCWFEAGVTKSAGRPATAAGLGLLEGSLCVHYSDDPDRRATFLDAVRSGMPGGYGLDDYSGLLWEEGRVAMALSARTGSSAYRVSAAEGSVAETRLDAWPLEPLTATGPPPEIAEFREELSFRQRAARAR